MIQAFAALLVAFASAIAPVGFLGGGGGQSFYSMASAVTRDLQASSGAWTMVITDWIPPDASSVRVRICNRDYLNGSHPAGAVTVDVAIGTSGATFPYSFSGTPTQYTGQTIPGGGAEYVSAWTAVTRGSDGKIAVSYAIPSGSAVRYEGLSSAVMTYWNTGVRQIYPLPALSAADYSIMTVHVEYNTNNNRVLVFGDSLSEGYRITKKEDNYVEFLKTTYHYAADRGGSQGSKLQDWANPAKPWFTDLQLYPGTSLIIELGGNDTVGRTAGQMETDFATIVSNARALGVTNVIAMTVAPGALFTCATSQTFNTWLKAGVSGVDHVLDIVPVLRSVADPCVLHASYDSGDGTHWSSAGHAAVSSALAAVLP